MKKIILTFSLLVCIFVQLFALTHTAYADVVTFPINDFAKPFPRGDYQPTQAEKDEYFPSQNPIFRFLTPITMNTMIIGITITGIAILCFAALVNIRNSQNQNTLRIGQLKKKK